MLAGLQNYLTLKMRTGILYICKMTDGLRMKSQSTFMHGIAIMKRPWLNLWLSGRASFPVWT